ncbi:MAG: acetyl-CoA C-acyltransferase, partial [Acidimicrobiia bacterium]|nr:acetyl-CoA C-acyltransferase [Acidimicrobiia bacterium]
MPDAVVVAVTRSPIGRAVKGSLASMRPDDLAAGIVVDALGKVPALDPAEVEDVVVGGAPPAAGAGANPPPGGGSPAGAGRRAGPPP